MKVTDYNEFAEAVSKWNEARYEREYNHELTVKLLEEELAEAEEAFAILLEKGTVEAAAHVQKEIADVLFVVEGAVWKAEPDSLNEWQDYALQELQILCTLDLSGIGLMQLAMAEFRVTKNVSALAGRMAFFGAYALEECGVESKEHMYEVLNAVCISNASKPVVKTASNVKANAGDKGPLFVKAEPIIEALMTRGQGYVQ